MRIPQYIYGSAEEMQRYFALLINECNNNLSDNGWVVPSITNNQLTIQPVRDQNGNPTTLSAFMPDGTLWYVTDASPPCYVGKISGSLVKFTTTPYP